MLSSLMLTQAGMECTTIAPAGGAQFGNRVLTCTQQAWLCLFGGPSPPHLVTYKPKQSKGFK